MESLKRIPADLRDIDFLATGIVTDRRKAMLGRLAQLGLRTHSAYMVPRYLRDGLLARSHVNLSVNKFEGPHQIVSVMRICHSVVNRVPVIPESADESGPYARYCLATDAAHLIHDAAEFVRHANIDEFAEDMLAMFRRQDMRETIRELVSQI